MASYTADDLRDAARLLRWCKRRPQVASHVRGRRLARIECHRQCCAAMCVALGLPENAASGTRKHLEEALANLQLNPKR